MATQTFGSIQADVFAQSMEILHSGTLSLMAPIGYCTDIHCIVIESVAE